MERGRDRAVAVGVVAQDGGKTAPDPLADIDHVVRAVVDPESLVLMWVKPPNPGDISLGGVVLVDELDRALV